VHVSSDRSNVTVVRDPTWKEMGSSGFEEDLHC